MNMKPHCLPPAWVWTYQGKIVEGGILYAARDSRWEPTIPDVVGTSVGDVRRTAWECDNGPRILGD